MESQIAPHVCPHCGAPCYLGAFDLECTNGKCGHFHAETAAAYGREQFPSAFNLLDDEPTEPRGNAAWLGTPVNPWTNDVSDDWCVFAISNPTTDAELAQSIKDAVAEAKADPKCTPQDAKDLDEWLEEMLRDYVTAFQDFFLFPPGTSL